MRTPREQEETDYLNKRLANVVAALKGNSELKVKFMAFAQERAGIDPIKLGMRLYNTLQGGRPPSSVMAVLLIEFESTALKSRGKRPR